MFQVFKICFSASIFFILYAISILARGLGRFCAQTSKPQTRSQLRGPPPKPPLICTRTVALLRSALPRKPHAVSSHNTPPIQPLHCATTATFRSGQGVCPACQARRRRGMQFFRSISFSHCMPLQSRSSQRISPCLGSNHPAAMRPRASSSWSTAIALCCRSSKARSWGKVDRRRQFSSRRFHSQSGWMIFGASNSRMQQPLLHTLNH